MSRNRAPVDGGYVRRTVSLPKELDDRIRAYLNETPGLTLSAFLSAAGDERVARFEKRKMKK